MKGTLGQKPHSQNLCVCVCATVSPKHPLVSHFFFFSSRIFDLAPHTAKTLAFLLFSFFFLFSPSLLSSLHAQLNLASQHPPLLFPLFLLLFFFSFFYFLLWNPAAHNLARSCSAAHSHRPHCARHLRLGWVPDASHLRQTPLPSSSLFLIFFHFFSFRFHP